MLRQIPLVRSLVYQSVIYPVAHLCLKIPHYTETPNFRNVYVTSILLGLNYFKNFSLMLFEVQGEHKLGGLFIFNFRWAIKRQIDVT
jgi:hypothetical protein